MFHILGYDISMTPRKYHAKYFLYMVTWLRDVSVSCSFLMIIGIFFLEQFYIVGQVKLHQITMLNHRMAWLANMFSHKLGFSLVQMCFTASSSIRPCIFLSKMHDPIIFYMVSLETSGLAIMEILSFVCALVGLCLLRQCWPRVIL